MESGIEGSKSIYSLLQVPRISLHLSLCMHVTCMHAQACLCLCEFSQYFGRNRRNVIQAIVLEDCSALAAAKGRVAV